VCAEHLWHHVALALDIWPFQACATPSLLYELRQQYALILADYEHQMLRRGLWSLPRPSATGDSVRVAVYPGRCTPMLRPLLLGLETNQMCCVGLSIQIPAVASAPSEDDAAAGPPAENAMPRKRSFPAVTRVVNLVPNAELGELLRPVALASLPVLADAPQKRAKQQRAFPLGIFLSFF
jgi:hypothetical protein